MLRPFKLDSMENTEVPTAAQSNASGLVPPIEPETKPSSDISELTGSTAVDGDINKVEDFVASDEAQNVKEKPKADDETGLESLEPKGEPDPKREHDRNEMKNPEEGIEDDASDSDVNEEMNKPTADYVLKVAGRLTAKNLYDIYCKKLEIEEKKQTTPGTKVNKAPRFLRGFADYVRTLEDRIAKLEISVEEKAGKENDEKKEEKAVAAAPTGDPSMRIAFYKCKAGQPIDFIDLINEDSWKEKGTFTSEVDQKHFLRVLYEGNGTQSKGSEDEVPEPGIDILALQLHSAPVATFLEKLAQHQVHNNNLVRLIKPFRLLLQNVDAIKDHLKRLRELHSASTVQSLVTNSDSVEETKKETCDGSTLGSLAKVAGRPQQPSMDTKQAPYETPEALLHLQKLLDFIEKYMNDQIRLYEGLRSGTIATVAFQNVWMLFQPRDKVYSPYQKGGQFLYSYSSGPKDVELLTPRRDISQAYQVLATSGGTPLFGKLIPPREKAEDDIVVKLTKAGLIEEQAPRNTQKKKDKYSPLYIYACILGWSSSGFLPLTESFAIKPYEGEVEITSFDIYPINYRSQQSSDDKVQDLVERGMKFIDYTSVTHLQYQGLTLGRNQEEINGPVIVDLEQAAQEMGGSQNYSHWPRDGGRFWAKKTPLTAWEIPVQTCKDTACHLASHLSDMTFSQSRAQSDKIVRELQALLDDHAQRNDRSHVQSLKEALQQHGLLDLLPGSVQGFALRDRKWCKYRLSLALERGS
ncbi:hypothetical protein K458DRAFT_133217 [Lentithecium fluviatile CBS 122367]|uniref:DUF7025 domain-containing protein n=1 Tax=Lentithecium fluviatile CBS 122367 TaxID=1168545 RepID=A0A6G1IKT2_9PLEO|nr:hypothetical protein K458DRAFT_133217 [Lentithecium fluviatile CBS 122367]